MSLLLNPPGIGVTDRPPQLFQYGLAQHDRTVRIFVPFIEAGMSDAEAWDALFTWQQRLDIHRAVYGNKGTPRFPPTPQGRLL